MGNPAHLPPACPPPPNSPSASLSAPCPTCVSDATISERGLVMNLSFCSLACTRQTDRWKYARMDGWGSGLRVGGGLVGPRCRLQTRHACMYSHSIKTSSYHTRPPAEVLTCHPLLPLTCQLTPSTLHQITSYLPSNTFSAILHFVPLHPPSIMPTSPSPPLVFPLPFPHTRTPFTRVPETPPGIRSFTPTLTRPSFYPSLHKHSLLPFALPFLDEGMHTSAYTTQRTQTPHPPTPCAHASHLEHVPVGQRAASPSPRQLCHVHSLAPRHKHVERLLRGQMGTDEGWGRGGQASREEGGGGWGPAPCQCVGMGTDANTKPSRGPILKPSTPSLASCGRRKPGFPASEPPTHPPSAPHTPSILPLPLLASLPPPTPFLPPRPLLPQPRLPPPSLPPCSPLPGHPP